MTDSAPLACPRCALAHGIDERFCRQCGMPLVYAGTGESEPVTESHERARKIRPQYARGELIRVAGGRNQAEAEMIQGILLEEGIPSILRRSRGFDVPDFLAAGPRDVMVPESGFETAHELLADHDLASQPQVPGELPGIGSPQQLALWLIAAVVLGAGFFWVLFQLSG